MDRSGSPPPCVRLSPLLRASLLTKAWCGKIASTISGSITSSISVMEGGRLGFRSSLTLPITQSPKIKTDSFNFLGWREHDKSCRKRLRSHVLGGVVEHTGIGLDRGHNHPEIKSTYRASSSLIQKFLIHFYFITDFRLYQHVYPMHWCVWRFRS